MVYSWYSKLYIQDFMLYCMHSLSVADGNSENCVKSGDLCMGSQSVVYRIPGQVTWFRQSQPTRDPRNIIARSCDLYMGSQQWSHALLDCGWRDPKNIFPRSGDLFMGSHRVCLWDPRTGHMLRLTLADGIPRTLLLGQVINVWDPRAFFMGSHVKSHAYSLPWLTKSQKQF